MRTSSSALQHKTESVHWTVNKFLVGSEWWKHLYPPRIHSSSESQIRSVRENSLSLANSDGPSLMISVKFRNFAESRSRSKKDTNGTEIGDEMIPERSTRLGIRSPIFLMSAHGPSPTLTKTIGIWAEMWEELQWISFWKNRVAEMKKKKRVLLPYVKK